MSHPSPSAPRIACALLLAGLSISARSLHGETPATSPATAPATQAAGPAAQAAGPATQAAAPTFHVERGSLSLVIDGQGGFDPVDPFEARLRMKAYSGELSINQIVANGATVKKGDLLLEIDPAPLNRLIAAAENDALGAKAALERVVADGKVADEADVLAMTQQKESLKEAEDTVKWFDSTDGPQMLKQLSLNVDQAKYQYEDGEDELDQLKKMYKSEELTNDTADIVVKRAVRQVEIARQIYLMSKDRAEKVKAFSYPLLQQRMHEGLETARQQFDLFESSQRQGKIVRQTQLAAYRAGAEAANLRLSDLKADLARLTVTAPFDGIVGYGQVVNGGWTPIDPRTLRVGERVTGPNVLLTLYRPGRLRVVIDLPENKFFAVGAGQKASIDPVAFPELKYEGMCDVPVRVGTGVGGNYPLFISTGEVDARLIPGMKAQVHMDVPLVENVLLAPTSAVKEGSVWVKSDDKVEQRKVMTGRSDGKSIEVLSGLRYGEEVLTTAR